MKREIPNLFRVDLETLELIGAALVTKRMKENENLSFREALWGLLEEARERGAFIHAFDPAVVDPVDEYKGVEYSGIEVPDVPVSPIVKNSILIYVEEQDDRTYTVFATYSSSQIWILANYSTLAEAADFAKAITIEKVVPDLRDAG